MADILLDEKRLRDLTEFTDMMKALYSGELVSLNLIGDGVSERPGKGHGPLKLLAVLKEVGPGQLAKYAAVHGKWQKKGIGAPLMLTEDTLTSSTDVFPMEFLEMKDAYVLLHGKDVLGGLQIGLENLRRQVEEQVKGKFIHLRQAYMEAGGDRKALAGLIMSSIFPFVEAMKNTLRMMGRPVPAHREEAVREFCLYMGFGESPFIEALKLRREGGNPGREELEALFAGYLAQVGLMAEKIDKLGV